MRNYKLQPGIVLETVCGESLLIATREARKKCSYVKPINATGVFYWKLLEQGASIEEMVMKAVEFYSVDEEIIRDGLSDFLNALESMGYIYPEDEK